MAQNIVDKDIDSLQTQINSLLDKFYPIGSIYININNINPTQIIGGTWEKIYGRFLLSTSDGYPLGSTGGETQHTLTEGEMPNHTHSFSQSATGKATNYAIVDQAIAKAGQWGVHWETGDGYYAANGYLYETGGSGPHNNMPPYLVVNMWKRIK